MKLAKKKTSPISNLSTVLRMIVAADSQNVALSKVSNENLSDSKLPTDLSAPKLRLHIDSEDDDEQDEFQLDSPPTKQVEQLVAHLRQQQKELAQREADLQQQAYLLETQMLANEAGLKKRTAELEQQLTQVKRQQEQLQKLQHSLVSSQDAIRQVVERLVDDCPQEALAQQLTELRLQLNAQMSENFRQWERIVSAIAI